MGESMSVGNPNFVKERHVFLARCLKEGHSPWQINDRASGRTLGIALSTIANAIANPNTLIPIEDHINSESARQHLVRLIREIMVTLNLQGFGIVKSRYLKYSLEYTYGK
jgi:hypothetical protein